MGPRGKPGRGRLEINSMGLFLASGIEFILSIYGFIAMIVNEIISLNVVWVSDHSVNSFCTMVLLDLSKW